jgi:hypothetical protein
MPNFSTRFLQKNMLMKFSKSRGNIGSLRRRGMVIRAIASSA